MCFLSLLEMHIVKMENWELFVYGQEQSLMQAKVWLFNT